MKRYQPRFFVPNNPLAPRIAPEVAKEIGLNESLVLLQLEFWMTIEGEERDDYWWVRKTVREIQSTFIFWGTGTVSRTLTSLTNQGFIVYGNYDEGPGKGASWIRFDLDKIDTIKSIRLFQDGTTVVPKNDDSVPTRNNRPYKKDKEHTRENTFNPERSAIVAKRGGVSIPRDSNAKTPEEFIFPEQIEATPELLEFAARHGYEGDDLRDNIESMRIKRLRDNVKYHSNDELALDIQYWIKTCANNRDKRSGGY
jgi:hypothetical protein